MVKRVFFLFLALWILAAPVFAAGSTDHPNSVGQNFISPNFVGMGYFSSQQSTVYKDFMVAADGLISKYYGSFSDISLSSYPYLYLFYSIPYRTYDNFSLEFDITISAENLGLSSAKLYGGTVSTATDISLTYLLPLYIDDRHSYNGCSFVNLTAGGPYFTNVKYDYFVVELVCNSDSYIDRSVTFSERSSLSGSSSGSGTWQVNSVPSTSYVLNASSSSPSASYALFQQREINGVNYFFLNRSSSGTNSTVSSNPFTNLFQGTTSDSSILSLTSSGTISVSDYGTTMVYSSASMLYGNDGGLVDEVFDQGETLDQIAGDMSQIVEDMQAKQDAANDIGGATSEDQISGTQETISTGTAALDTFSNSAVSGLTDVSAQMQGYSALLAATVPSMLAFGEGDPLYWQLIGSISLAAIVIIARGLLRR